jgi:inner membrane protein
VDNVCHTLVGLALGEAGLKRWSRYATAALVISANLPDIDILVMATNVPAVGFRRGWTHGLLGQLLLPIVLTTVLTAFAHRRTSKGTNPPEARHDSRPSRDDLRRDFGALLALSYIGVFSHVLLDLANNYGVRLLMPFSNRWFYGDTLFIVDPWLWATLGIGAWLARTRMSVAPARRALRIAMVYIILMALSARAARTAVMAQWQADYGVLPRALMVGPVFADPLHKQVIVDRGDGYLQGSFSWITRSVRFDSHVVAKDAATDVAAAARQEKNVQALLAWARFPYYRLERAPSGPQVVVRDVRFGRFVSVATRVGSRDALRPSDPQ